MTKVKEVALVLDKEGNEMFFGETIGECQLWSKEHNVTGNNGEYIAVGLFDTVWKSFEAEDYCEINTNW